MNYFSLLLALLIWIPLASMAQENTNQTIPKEKAIRIAKHHGYYQTGEGWQSPVIILDTAAHCWEISCMAFKHVSKGPCYPEKCKCEETNGCTEEKIWKIKINAANGKIVRKMKRTKRLPNYE